MMHPNLPGLEPAYTAPEQPTQALRRYDFFVAGEPRPMGSKTAFAFIPKGGGPPRAVVTDGSNSKPAGKLRQAWKDSVIGASMAALGAADRITGPVAVSMTFYLARPAGHRSKRGGLTPSAPALCFVRPDLDKLARNTGDALGVTLLSEDSRIVRLSLEKRYADDGPTGARIVVEELG